MKARTSSTIYLTLAFGLMVAGSPIVLAQKPQPSAERPRLFQRLRDETRPPSKSNENSSATKPGASPKKPAANSASRPMSANPAAIAQPKSTAHPSHPIGQHHAAPVAVPPALRPLNRLAVPTLAPQLQPAQPSVAAPTPHSNAHQLGISLQDKDETVLVLTVEPSSSAYRDGLRPGDLIRSIGGVPLQSQAEFHQVAGLMQSGDQIEVVVSRAGSDKTFLLSIGQPDDVGQPETVPTLTLRDPRQDSSVASESFDESPGPTISSRATNSSLAPGLEVDRRVHLETSLRDSLRQKERQLRELQREIDAIRRQLVEVAQSRNFEVSR